MRSLRHVEREESAQSGAHEPTKNGVRESAATGTGNRTATRPSFPATRRTADESFAAGAGTAGAPANASVDASAGSRGDASATSSLVVDDSSTASSLVASATGACRSPPTTSFGAPTISRGSRAPAARSSFVAIEPVDER